MTLLIATYTSSNVVLTADGLCTKEANGKKDLLYDYQKIFPIEGTAVAVCHHGQSIFLDRGGGERPVGRVVSDFISKCGERLYSLTVRDMSQTVWDELDDDCRETLEDMGPATSIGFWVAGFGAGNLWPALYELWWPENSRPVDKRKGHFPVIVVGGEGKRFLPNPPGLDFGEYSDEMKKHHDKLYRDAEQRQSSAGETVFGGHRHQLVISRAGWSWSIPPSANAV